MSRLPAGFRQRAVPRRASPGAGNTGLLCCAPNQLFSCFPFSKSSISVDCESIILSTAFSRLLFPAFGPRESGSAVCSRRLRQDGASGQPGAGPGKEPCSGRIHALYIRIPRPPWKMQRERLFLKNTPIITESEVEQARIEPERRECLHITLNTQGGKTMKAATSAMNLGRDRLALVVQGKIKSAPVVQAVISRTFEISGLDGKMKPPDWRNCSTGRHPQKKTHPSFHRIWPCTPSIRKAAVWWKKESSAYRASGSGSSRRTGRKNGRGRISVPGEFSHHFRRLRQTCGARYGTSGKPGHHLERRSIP